MTPHRFRLIHTAPIAAALVGAWLLTGQLGQTVLAQTTLPLLTAANLIYQGGFRLPRTNDNNTYAYGGTGLSYRASNNALIVVGHDWYQEVGEVTVPTPGTAATVGGLPTAAPLIVPRDVLAGELNLVNPTSTNAKKIGGTLPMADGSLLVTGYDSYDGGGASDKSHFRVAANGTVTGPWVVGNAGFTSGWMLPIPAEWQSAFGATMMTGNCCLSVIGRTSVGPSVSLFDPTLTSDQPNATMVLGYPLTHPTLGTPSAPTDLYDMTTIIRGAAFVAGSRSVLFFGLYGTTSCYGGGTADPAVAGTLSADGVVWCYDPVNSAKGSHGYPYVSRVWAYDANDLVAVKNGTKNPWDVLPYTTWTFDLPFEAAQHVITGVAYDATTQRLFLGSEYGDTDGYPLIHVLKVSMTGTGGGADITPPTVAVSAPAAGATVSGTTNLTATASDNVGVAGVWFTVDGATVGSEVMTSPFQVSWNSSTVANGSHMVQAVAQDAAGNTTTSSPVSITVANAVADTTAPTVAVTAPGAAATVSGAVSVTATATDNVGVVGVQFTLDGAALGAEDTSAPYATTWTTTGAANGAHSLAAIARDAAGNKTTSSAVTVTVTNAAPDTTAPTVNITAPAGGTTLAGAVTVTAAASDNIGVVGVQFTLDGATLGAEDTSSPYSITWTTTSSTNGSRVLRAVARDAAGNTTTSAPITVTVANTPQDTTTPSVSMTAPTAGATVSGTVTVSATATDNTGIAGVQFTLDGVNLGNEDTTAPYAISWATTSATNGSHTLRAVARDTSGNTSASGSVIVMVNNTTGDTTAPTVSMTSPGVNATVSGTIAVTASASDNVGVVGVQFTLDGVNLGSEDAISPYSASWNTTGTANGAHTLRAVARDAAGNTRTSTARTVTVNNAVSDTLAPTIAMAAPLDGATVAGNVVLSATSTDNVGVVGVQFAVDGVNVGTEDKAAPYTMTWAAGAVLNGTHVITAQARDAAGNTRTSTSVTVTLRNLGSGVPGDMNDDGSPDLVFENASGQIYTWYMNAGTMTSGAAVSPSAVNPVWQIVSLDDFDGDKKSDILWENTTNGQVYLWLMDHNTLIGEVSVVATDTTWRIARTADFNGDGKVDILWKDPTTGTLSVWFMNGTTFVGSASLNPGQVDPSWRLAGSADLNHDGQADLIWQNRTTGELVYWLMNGLTATSIGHFTPGATDVLWEVRAVGDFDGDGQVDLIFEHATTGQLYAWYLSGTTMVRGSFLTPAQVSPAWRIMGGR